jgi:hypothetical protein
VAGGDEAAVRLEGHVVDGRVPRHRRRYDAARAESAVEGAVGEVADHAPRGREAAYVKAAVRKERDRARIVERRGVRRHDAADAERRIEASVRQETQDRGARADEGFKLRSHDHDPPVGLQRDAPRRRRGSDREDDAPVPPKLASGVPSAR